jgi:hypothetical protein
LVIAAADLGLIGITFHERFARGNRVLLGCGYVCAKPVAAAEATASAARIT